MIVSKPYAMPLVWANIIIETHKPDCSVVAAIISLIFSAEIVIEDSTITPYALLPISPRTTTI